MSIGKGFQVSAETAKLIAVALLACLAMWVGGKVMDWREASNKAETDRNISLAATDISNDTAVADKDREDTDAAANEGKQTYEREIERSQRDPVVRARADAGVPSGVRNAFKQRRLARERSGCPAGGCEEGPEDPDAAER